ncbi:hypothetical protein GCM10010191_71240 [Actinomadura vinacea]|uniref:ADP-ribosylglycohydrolase family protein n=1 Tax=Actinomadura vinacea TaxID=115336 RepID=A0ABP5X425_9ACTN
MVLTREERLVHAEKSLIALSAGDAFGDQFFMLDNRNVSPETGVPPAPWAWSDDTEMACSVVDVLRRFGEIDQDALAEAFAERFDIGRRYGAGAFELLERIQRGDHWHRASRELFDGKGSFGNGNRISAQDTVPFALWAAATRLTDYEAAVRACVMVGGDMDTTAAIVGGVVGAHLGPDGIPSAWRKSREPLPGWLTNAT